MPRIPLAAKQLRDQLNHSLNRTTAESRAATAVPAGDPDGLGVYRTVSFDETASKGLAEKLEALADPRVESFKDVDGQLEVTFVSTVKADTRDPFTLAAAELALQMAEEESAAEPAAEPRPAKKAAAKKAAASGK